MERAETVPTTGSLSKGFGGFLCVLGCFGMLVAVLALVDTIQRGSHPLVREFGLEVPVLVFAGALCLLISGVVIRLLARIAIALENQRNLVSK